MRVCKETPLKIRVEQAALADWTGTFVLRLTKFMNSIVKTGTCSVILYTIVNK